MSLSLSWLDSAAVAASLRRLAELGNGADLSAMDAGDAAAPAVLFSGVTGFGVTGSRSPSPAPSYWLGSPHLSTPGLATPGLATADAGHAVATAAGVNGERPGAGGGQPEPRRGRGVSPAKESAAHGAQVDAFQMESGSLKDRLDSYLTWTIDKTSSSSAFVIDAEGLVLAERESDGELVAIASSLAHQLQRLRTSLEEHNLGTFAVDLDRCQVLHLAEVEAELGRFAVGFVSDQEVPGSTRKLLQSGLSLVMAE